MNIKRLKELYNEGFSDEEIAKELGVTHGAINYWRKRLDLPALPIAKRKKVVLPKLSEKDIGYIAGFLDGEGCFCLSRSQNTYRANINVPNTNKEIINWLHSTLEIGRIYERKYGKQEWKDCYVFLVERIGEIKVLTDLLIPCLKIKKEQAESLNKFCNLRLSLPAGIPSYSDIEDEIYLKLRELNRKGKNV